MNTVKTLQGKSIKSGDTKPSLRLKLLKDGNPFNLNGYSATITIKVVSNGEVIVNSPVTIENGKRGIVEYQWSSGETDTASVYEVEVVVFDSTTERTFPSRGTETINVEERLA